MNKMLEDFIRFKRLQCLSEPSLKSYSDILKPFCRFCDCTPDKLTIDTVFAYLESTLSKGRSKATYATYCRNIKIFLKYGFEKGYTTVPYEDIFVPKSPRRVVRMLSSDEIKDIFTASSASDIVLNFRNTAILALMFDSGLRQAEICDLLTADINLSGGCVLVHGKGDKERYAPIGHATACYLASYMGVRPESDLPYFFLDVHGNQLSRNAVKLFVSRLSNRLGIDFSSHKLRHNFATNFCLDEYEKSGQIDVYMLMYLMGHEDLKTTKAYLHFALNIIAARHHSSHLDKLGKT